MKKKDKQNTKPNFKTYKTAILEIIVIASKNNWEFPVYCLKTV